MQFEKLLLLVEFIVVAEFKISWAQQIIFSSSGTQLVAPSTVPTGAVATPAPNYDRDRVRVLTIGGEYTYFHHKFGLVCYGNI